MQSNSITVLPPDPRDVCLELSPEALLESSKPAYAEQFFDANVTIWPCLDWYPCHVPDTAARVKVLTVRSVTLLHDLVDRLQCWTDHKSEEVEALFEAAPGIDRDAQNEDVTRFSDALRTWLEQLEHADIILKYANDVGKLHYRNELMAGLSLTLESYRALCHEVEAMCSAMRTKVMDGGCDGCCSRTQHRVRTKVIPLTRPLGLKLKPLELKFGLMVMELRRYQQTSRSGLSSHQWLL